MELGSVAGSRQPFPPSTDHVKHRRTRSGCYTCRGRRVKCDEKRPICERCRKGSRECAYPEPRPSTKSSSGSKLGQRRVRVHDHGWSSDELDTEDAENPPRNLQNQDTAQSPLPRTQTQNPIQNNPVTHPKKRSDRSIEQLQPSIETSDSLKEKSRSPSTDGSSALSASNSARASFMRKERLSPISTDTSPETLPWSHLPDDLQYYLQYHRNHLTYHHYFFGHHSDHFLHIILLDQALSYEPLLFAVVGFAAFQMALKRPNGKIEDFLGYYNQSVTLLRKSLAGGQEHSQSTLLTILQLATFEEYLGDWVNLLGHQKAAHGILLELYSADSIMNNEVQRKILSWYSRFDLFAGLMSGYETMLAREWFCANDDYYRHQSQEYPNDINYKIETAIASHRLIAMEMAVLFAKLPRGAISLEEFVTEHEKLSMRFSTWKQHLDTLLENTRSLVETFEVERKPNPEDIIDPYMPGGIFKKGFWTLNIMLMDWYATDVMYRYQSALMLQRHPPAELEDNAIKVCSMFEAIEYWPEGPPGIILSAQAALGIATLFLPKDDRHTMWCRRKLAKIESLGAWLMDALSYIYPPTFRSKLAQLWGLPEISHWWLPNDEGYPAIVRSIRAFMEDRSLHANSQAKSEDVRTLKAIFSKLTVEDDDHD